MPRARQMLGATDSNVLLGFDLRYVGVVFL